MALPSRSNCKLFCTPARGIFLEFIQETMKDSSLSLREKELIAISLAALSRWELCFEVHLDKARECGLKEAEIKEALSMAIMFGGATVMMFIEAMKEKTRTLTNYMDMNHFRQS